LALAELNLERTIIKAPFDGRVQQKQIDEGQYVSPGMNIGTIFSVDIVEISVALNSDDLAWLDFPNGKPVSQKSKVLVTGIFAGELQEWHGYLDRLSGEMDDRTRMINAVIVVPDPYNEKLNYPLLNGLFVDVQIPTRSIAGLYSIPIQAVRDNNTIWLVENNLLNIVKINPVWRNEDAVFTRNTLSDGDMLVTSSLRYAVDGMPVSTERK